MQASDWQSKLSSSKERHLYAYNNSLFCDVELSVMDANGDKVPIPAHKYVLAISSPVFEAMFYGESAETGRTIDLSDTTKEGLQEMFRYVYSDEVNLNGSNVLEVLYLAEKYMLPFLKEKCEEYLEKELKPEEVFHVLPQIRIDKVEQKCWDMVDSDAERAVSSESFLNISKEMLCKVLGRDTISIDEVDLFQAVEKWALNKLKQKGLEENRKNRRAVLGEEVIQLIRFPLMSQKIFAEKVLPSGILKMDEVTELIQFFNNLDPVKSLFSNMERAFFVPNARFNTILAPSSGPRGYWSYSGGSDAIDFVVNKSLSLVGVRLFGSKSSTYNVTLALYKSAQTIKLIQSSTFPTEDKKTDGYYGFTILLDKPVPLDPDVVYTIEATISGPALSYYGEDLDTNFTSSSDLVIIRKIVNTVDGIIKIRYMNSDKSKNGTLALRGQFPTLIFRRFPNYLGERRKDEDHQSSQSIYT